ncbi:hypothetical protein AJ80_03085 [Polytolypa hystricis UAMH7299]|uniref:Uncharacterized protein n=1 Tax=Polytolypa hystricis (strain UAMH7299) TaxID=1447883 RepID=A0A2B7YLB5_POLH7|nr:hypothetical protein AJ80_03085 [Polytolypa hystricis UAMH7299]
MIVFFQLAPQMTCLKDPLASKGPAADVMQSYGKSRDSAQVLKSKRSVCVEVESVAKCTGLMLSLTSRNHILRWEYGAQSSYMQDIEPFRLISDYDRTGRAMWNPWLSVHPLTDVTADRLSLQQSHKVFFVCNTTGA